VQLSDDADGPVSADAVRAVREGKLDRLAGPGTVASGDPITLTARVIDPSGSAVQAVAFYYDSNYSGKLEPEADQLLGLGTDGTEGWSLEVPSDDLPLEANVFFAQSSTAAGPINWATAVVQITPPPDPGGTTFDGAFGLLGGGMEMNSMSQYCGLSLYLPDDTTITMYGVGALSASGSFDDTGGDVTFVSVDFGDGDGYSYEPNTSSDSFDLSHSYGWPGDFTVSAYAEDEEGYQVSASFVVTVELPADLSLDVSSDEWVTLGDTCHLGGQISDSRGNEWSGGIDWGDGSGDGISGDDGSGNVSWSFGGDHQYAQPGDYTVSVYVENDYGDSDSASLQVSVVAPIEMTPADDATIWAGDTFTSSGSFTATRGSQWQVWADYGDGSSDEVPWTWDANNFWYAFEFSHPYDTPDDYTVTVTVWNDDYEDSASDSLLVTVLEAESPLDVGGEENMTTGDTFERMVYVTGSFVEGYPGSQLSAWVDYGEGSPQSPYDFSRNEYSGWWTFLIGHTYQDEGSYTVTVTVQNAIGEQQAASFQVTVQAPPDLEVHAGGQYAFLPGRPVYLTASASGPNVDAGAEVSYSWDLNKVA
jgi:PKD repeat protein